MRAAQRVSGKARAEATVHGLRDQLPFLWRAAGASPGHARGCLGHGIKRGGRSADERQVGRVCNREGAQTEAGKLITLFRGDTPPVGAVLARFWLGTYSIVAVWDRPLGVEAAVPITAVRGVTRCVVSWEESRVPGPEMRIVDTRHGLHPHPFLGPHPREILLSTRLSYYQTARNICFEGELFY